MANSEYLLNMLRGRDDPASFAAVDRIEELEAKLAKARDALTPSAATKAAYMGEFWFPFEVYLPDGYSDIVRVTVPWVVIKEIMKKISARAALAELEDKTDG